jgi:hypothetical protein
LPDTAAAYEAWGRVAARAGAGLLQVGNILELHRQTGPKETPLYLAEVLARNVFEAAFYTPRGGYDSRIDVFIRLQIRRLFGAEMLAQAEAVCTEMGVQLLDMDRMGGDAEGNRVSGDTVGEGSTL